MSLVSQSVRQVRKHEVSAASSVGPASVSPHPTDVDAELEKILARGRAKLPPQERVEQLLRALWNRKSGAAFYAEQRPGLYAYALKVMRNHANAEAALSQTFVEFLEGRTDKRFFFKALRSNCEDLHRRLSFQARITRPLDVIRGARSITGGKTSHKSAPPGPRLEGGVASRDNRDPLEILLKNDAEKDVERELEQLSPKIKEVLFLICLAGLEYREVSVYLGVSEETVRARVCRARRFFRARNVTFSGGSREY